MSSERIKRKFPNKPRFQNLQIDYEVEKAKEEAKELVDRRRWRIDLAFNIANIVFAFIIGYIGINLTRQSNNMNETMLSLAKKSDSTGLDIAHFNQLLDKTAIILTKDSQLVTLTKSQIDSLVALTRQTATVADVMKGQYDMNAQEANSRTLDLLNKRIEDYNSLSTVVNNLQEVIVFYKVSLDGDEIGNKVLQMEDVNKRVIFLESAYSSLIKYTHIQDLFPKTTIIKVWEDCMNNISSYKVQCKINLTLGNNIDTTSLGIEGYREVLGKISNLIDTIATNIEPSKAITQRQIKIIRTELDSNLTSRQRIL